MKENIGMGLAVVLGLIITFALPLALARHDSKEVERTRSQTIEEIKAERYKGCIKYAPVKDLPACKSLLD